MIALLGALALTACSGEDSTDGGGTEPGSTVTTTEADTGSEVAKITISDFSFSGAETAVTGETVTVTNEDSVSHTWTSDDGLFDSGSLASGDSFEFVFDEPGEYTFHCSIHTSMTGAITVEG